MRPHYYVHMNRTMGTFQSILVLVAVFGVAPAQAPTGIITGVVIDEKGPVEAAARVTITNRANGLSRNLITSADGSQRGRRNPPKSLSRLPVQRARGRPPQIPSTTPSLDIRTTATVPSLTPSRAILCRRAGSARQIERIRVCRRSRACCRRVLGSPRITIFDGSLQFGDGGLVSFGGRRYQLTDRAALEAYRQQLSQVRNRQGGTESRG